jgi:hypothetical protein
MDGKVDTANTSFHLYTATASAAVATVGTTKAGDLTGKLLKTLVKS